MRKIEFSNEEIKKEYKSIINAHHGIAGIILLLTDDGNTIKINNIIDEEFGKHIIIEKNNELYDVDIDFLKKKMYLKAPDKPYSTIYDIYPRKFFSPDGYLYQKDNRSIRMQFTIKTDDNTGEVKHYDLFENGNNYLITAKFKNELFDEEYFVEGLLNRQEKFKSVRDVFLAIIDLFGLNDIDIKLCDSLGSNIVIKNGAIEKYLEYQEKGNDYQKIYLQDGDFFVEKKVTGEYRDELTFYIKRLGVKNGKEKR